ncbi:MAG TPA: SUMF1/EgtB/PvdO family nonheme iron enzyme [Fibrobacteria bacterium]|nr:SUMF1/EgtB/PvdO family nonheme iron enzyme [Fibrobacteria bacterium]
MISFKKIQWTLGVIALGVLYSCGSKVPEEPFPQDRNVGGLNISDLRKGVTLPDSLSGWYLRWVPPLSATGLYQYYIFEDTLKEAEIARLNNGTQAMDLSSLPAYNIVSVADVEKDTIWEIPSRIFDGKRFDSVSRTKPFRFAVWARYLDGPIGQPVSYTFFLGDEMPPRIPTAMEFQDSIGDSRITLRFPRPGDQTGRFDTIQKGPLRSIEFLSWPGRVQFDSVGKVTRWKVSPEDLADRKKDTLEIVLTGLRSYTPYVVVMVAVDSVGNVARSAQMQFTTRDSLPPAPVQKLSAKVGGNELVVSWDAATDTFGAGKVAIYSRPNKGIAWYRIRLDGKWVDSVDLRPQMDAFLSSDPNDAVDPGRFQWRYPKWIWKWPNLRPGQRYTVEVHVQDVSGNQGMQPESFSDSLPPVISGARCRDGYVAVKGDTIAGIGRLKDFCIEEHEHAQGDSAISRVTWEQAIALCAKDGASLCSEAQWVRACETSPTDSEKIYPYGAMEVGAGGDLDSLAWLQEACQLGTGDSTRARSVSNADPRCVSAWGAYDLPGRLGEWTLDVFSTVRNPSGWDSGNLAYRGPSDLTGRPDLGTLHGGSALVLEELAQTLGSAKCRTRNYPASSELDTLRPQGTIRRRPNPAGVSLGWGFRCCVTF